MSQTCIIQTTVGSEAAAQRMAKVLLDKKLCACVQRLPGVKSSYYWDGEIQASTETLLIFKTLFKFSAKLMQAVKELHPYEVPEITCIGIDKIDSAYQQWIESVLQP